MMQKRRAVQRIGRRRRVVEMRSDIAQEVATEEAHVANHRQVERDVDVAKNGAQ